MPRIGSDRVSLTLSLPEEMVEPLARAAKKGKLSPSAWAVKVLAESLGVRYIPRKAGRPKKETKE